MQDPSYLLNDEWPRFLGMLPSDLDLDQLANSTGALMRRRGVRDAASLLRLALVRGPGGLSLRETASWAALLGVAQLTDPSLHDRLHQSCDFLSAIVDSLLAAKVAGPSLFWPGRSIRLADGTCLSKPGSKGTDWRIHAVYDLGRGGFSALELTDGHGGEALDRGVPV